ncbi:glucose-dependent insulinotropic receptor [Periophthalmus magnuspinnatus]|uniref:glucose-dependent insulinotropic receptor n=1 Tax=Periophthalmus magnuspinnatus TaxID=409849 RepID=UPI00145AFB79|nr:glucose-dependent insulinotropic receptor [Periophthalmus magnuspinnatus]
MAVILITASCAIISTNLLVAAALLKILFKKKRQSWCFVLNLAVADTLVGVAITGLATEDLNTDGANNNATQSRSNMAQSRGRCLLRMTFVSSPCIASIMSMFLISLDRYAAIKMPLKYAQRSGRAVAFWALASLWVCAFALGFMPVYVPALQSDLYRGFCDFFSVIYDVGIIILYSVCFFPVVSVFLYIYLDILKIACSHQRQILEVRQAGSRTSEHGSTSDHHNKLKSPYWSHVRALRTVAMLVGCFVLLWCPFFITGVVKLLCGGCQLTQLLEGYLFLLGLSNSLLNPLVYAFWQKEVRQTLAQMFSGCKRKTRQQSGTGGSGHHQHNTNRDDANATCAS